MDARARRWARVSVGAGAVVLLLAVVSALLPQPRPCGDLPDRYPPIIAFELARDGRDLVALFGPPGACRDRMVAAMDTANVVDLAAFLPAYALFLAAWFACRRGAAPRAARLGAAIVVGAALADVLENVCLLALTPGLDPASPWLARLPWVTGVKWLGLGAAATVAAAIHARGGRWGRLGAALCALAPLATVAATIDPPGFGPVVSLGVAAGWIACLVDAARRARVTAPAA
ncbi:MAG: hypothetical protein IPH44_14430 [Myxococcales bacterium]|nr:hypothetical protein [Myxococcales bacterium]MBK7193125.1 hypothetical protein [Myxococcales bacterium]